MDEYEEIERWIKERIEECPVKWLERRLKEWDRFGIGSRKGVKGDKGGVKDGVRDRVRGNVKDGVKDRVRDNVKDRVRDRGEAT